MKRGKYIKLTRVNYAPKRREGEWTFGIFMRLVLLCWPSKHGGYFTIQDLSFIGCIKRGIFRIAHFMEAKLGNNPSFVWCSLLAARAPIHASSRLQIGDGRKVGGATHFRLPNALVFLNAPAMEMKVNDLIDKDTRQWDRGKLSATFDHRTCEKILALPLNQLRSTSMEGE